MTKIETFAEQYRLKATRDECNDRVIQGRRGQLYFDGGQLCLMVLDGKPAKRSKWKAPGGWLWMGDISKNAQGVAGPGCENHRHPARERTAGNPHVPNQAETDYDRRAESGIGQGA